jgi:hypothetical protein
MNDGPQADEKKIKKIGREIKKINKGGFIVERKESTKKKVTPITDFMLESLEHQDCQYFTNTF